MVTRSGDAFEDRVPRRLRVRRRRRRAPFVGQLPFVPRPVERCEGRAPIARWAVHRPRLGLWQRLESQWPSNLEWDARVALAAQDEPHLLEGVGSVALHRPTGYAGLTDRAKVRTGLELAYSRPPCQASVLTFCCNIASLPTSLRACGRVEGPGGPTARAGPPGLLRASFPLTGGRCLWPSRFHDAFYQSDGATFVEYRRPFGGRVGDDRVFATGEVTLVEDTSALFGCAVPGDFGAG